MIVMGENPKVHAEMHVVSSKIKLKTHPNIGCGQPYPNHCGFRIKILQLAVLVAERWEGGLQM